LNCSPTLTADEFKTIHNALCDLDSVKQSLEDVLNKDLYIKLAKATSQIREGLANAYEQDNKSFDEKSNHYDSVRTDLGLTAIWSIFEIDNLSDRHPFGDVLQVAYTDHWGEKPVYAEVNGLTWAALYVAANAAIRDSGDKHHIYIEDFRPNPKNPQQLILSTGS
jgi:hypothetical protein